MKKYIVRLFGIVAALTLAIGCANVEEGGENNGTVTFPEKVVATVAPGEIFTLNFDAATRWEMSVPAEVSAWFSIVDGKNTTVSLRGGKGAQEVQIQVRNVVDYRQSHSCEVSLTMGDRTEVIAELTLPAASREINAYAATINKEDNTFVLDSLSNFVYETTPTESVEMFWMNGMFRQRFAVEANFNWSMVGEIPAWLELSATSGEKGRTEVVVNTILSELPLEATNVEFKLCDYTDTENPVEVETFIFKYGGCTDIHKISMSYQLRFNTIGDYYDPVHAMDYVPGAATGVITAPYGVVFYTLAERGGKLYHDRNGAWMTLTISDYPEGSTPEQKGLYERVISLTVTSNTQMTERKAYLLALPAKVAATITDPNTQLYADEEHTAVAYELRDYIYGEVEQLPYVPPGVIDATDIATMRGFNANFEEVENAEFMTGEWAEIADAFRLSYKEKDSGDYLTFNVPFSRYEVYGYAGQSDKFENLDDCWISLSANPDTEIENCYRINMDDKKNTKKGPNGENVAYVVFYNSENVAYAVVECVLDANYVAPPSYEVDTSAVAFIGEESFGETIEFLTPSDPDWNATAASQYPGIIQVRINHRSAMSSLRGMKLPDFTTWRSTQEWLQISYNAGLPCVDMQKLTGNKGKGVITLYDANNTAVAILVCVFGYNG